jgi:hypothetical protein
LIRKINKHLLIKRQDTQAIEFNSHFNDTWEWKTEIENYCSENLTFSWVDLKSTAILGKILNCETYRKRDTASKLNFTQ